MAVKDELRSRADFLSFQILRVSAVVTLIVATKRKEALHRRLTRYANQQ
jgi:hypothetical protein